MQPTPAAVWERLATQSLLDGSGVQGSGSGLRAQGPAGGCVGRLRPGLPAHGQRVPHGCVQLERESPMAQCSCLWAQEAVRMRVKDTQPRLPLQPGSGRPQVAPWSAPAEEHSAQVLLDAQGRAKLADTGLAVVLASASHRTELSARGTFPYLAPEVLMGAPACPSSTAVRIAPARAQRCRAVKASCVCAGGRCGYASDRWAPAPARPRACGSTVQGAQGPRKACALCPSDAAPGGHSTMAGVGAYACVASASATDALCLMLQLLPGRAAARAHHPGASRARPPPPHLVRPCAARPCWQAAAEVAHQCCSKA